MESGYQFRMLNLVKLLAVSFIVNKQSFTETCLYNTSEIYVTLKI